MSKEDTTILLRDAVHYAARWRQVEGTYNKHHELHAFVIPKNDFKGILTEEIDAVRGYLGVDNNGVEKLMFVGTKWNAATKTYEDMLPAPGNNNQIYDLTMPCPNACDQKSILNTLLLEEK